MIRARIPALVNCARWLPALLALLGGYAVAVQAEAPSDARYDFKVFLDDEEIGRQHFIVNTRGETTTVEIEADFKVKVLFVTAYVYQHSNTEIWESSCLESIQSYTNDDGEQEFIEGAVTPDGVFRMTTHAGSKETRGCVRTFPYWNRAWLESDELLNSQTGERLPARLEFRGRQTIPVRGAPQLTEHYRLSAGKLEIDLWYAEDGRWVALESLTTGGKRLVYQLQ